MTDVIRTDYIGSGQLLEHKHERKLVLPFNSLLQTRLIMTNTLRTQIEGQLALLIRGELVSQCQDMQPADRPFNVYNPGDDPHFHQVVADIKEDLLQHMAELVEERLTA